MASPMSIESTPTRSRPTNINVRKQTEELASLVLTDASSQLSRSYADRDDGYSTVDEDSEEDRYSHQSSLVEGDEDYGREYDDQHYQASQSAFSSRPVSPTGSDGSLEGLKRPPSQSSHLSRLLRDSPPLEGSASDRSASPESQETRIHIGRNASRDNLGESSSLMGGRSSDGYGSIPQGSDEEAQYYHKRKGFRGWRNVVGDVKERPWTLIDPAVLTRENIWREAVVKPVLAVPSVILGLLLNVLDGLSYGE